MAECIPLSNEEIRKLCINYLDNHMGYESSTYEEYPHWSHVFIEYDAVSELESDVAMWYWEETDLIQETGKETIHIHDRYDDFTGHETADIDKEKFNRFEKQMQVVLLDLLLFKPEKYEEVVKKYME